MYIPHHNRYIRYRRPWAFGVALYISLIPFLEPLAKVIAFYVGIPEISTNGKDWRRL